MKIVIMKLFFAQRLTRMCVGAFDIYFTTRCKFSVKEQHVIMSIVFGLPKNRHRGSTTYLLGVMTLHCHT